MHSLQTMVLQEVRLLLLLLPGLRQSSEYLAGQLQGLLLAAAEPAAR